MNQSTDKIKVQQFKPLTLVYIDYVGKYEEVQIENIPEMDVVVMKFKGPGSEKKLAYKKIKDRMEVNDYEWNGPSYEVCSKKP